MIKLEYIKHTLLVGSKSKSRYQLLAEAAIPFDIIEQEANETCCDWGNYLPKVVEQIALLKMQHVILPEGKDGERCFVLTADTMSQDKDGNIHGKPTDRADAIAKIKRARQGSFLCTAFCLDKKIWRAGKWEVDKRVQKVVSAEYIFDIPDEWIEEYLNNSPGLSASNAIAIEGFGAQFLKIIHGSYTTIVGLPMFELRQALMELGFYS